MVTKHLSHGLDFQGAYTYSRSLDTTAGQMYNTDCGNGAFGTAVGPVPFNLKLDKGPSCSDVPQSMHLSVLYHLPDFKSEGFVSKMVNGWWIGNIVTAVQGFPFTPLVGLDRSFSGVITQSNQTPVSLNTTSSTETLSVGTNSSPVSGCTTNTCTYNFIPYDPKTVVTGDPNHWFNPLMFGEAPLGQIGNSPRDILRGPGVGTWNFSINKDTKLGFLGEQGSLEFRMEIFNLLNRANFGPPTNVTFAGTTAFNNSPANTQNSSLGGNIQSPNGAAANNPLGNVGQITTTSTSSRQIQLALKVVF